MVHYLYGFEPELKFFGTMNGSSRPGSHTNAYFCPNKHTLVFLDLSALNTEKALKLLNSKPEIKHYFACVTHTHYDHATGFEELAFAIKSAKKGELLTFITDRSVGDDLVAQLDSSGMRSVHLSITEEDKVYELLSFDMYGGGYTFCDKHGKELPKLPRPDWFIRTLPTTHSLRLNACGFAFQLHGKLIVYSGDTNELTTFKNFLSQATGRVTNYDDESTKHVGKHTDHDDPPIEFYLDMATRKSEMHLCFSENAEDLKAMLGEYPTLKLILMHYDNAEDLEAQIRLLMPGTLGERVFIAQEED